MIIVIVIIMIILLITIMKVPINTVIIMMIPIIRNPRAADLVPGPHLPRGRLLDGRCDRDDRVLQSYTSKCI